MHFKLEIKKRTRKCRHFVRKREKALSVKNGKSFDKNPCQKTIRDRCRRDNQIYPYTNPDKEFLQILPKQQISNNLLL